MKLAATLGLLWAARKRGRVGATSRKDSQMSAHSTTTSASSYAASGHTRRDTSLAGFQANHNIDFSASYTVSAQRRKPHNFTETPDYTSPTTSQAEGSTHVRTVASTFRPLLQELKTLASSQACFAENCSFKQTILINKLFVTFEISSVQACPRGTPSHRFVLTKIRDAGDDAPSRKKPHQYGSVYDYERTYFRTHAKNNINSKKILSLNFLQKETHASCCPSETTRKTQRHV